MLPPDPSSPMASTASTTPATEGGTAPPSVGDGDGDAPPPPSRARRLARRPWVWLVAFLAFVVVSVVTASFFVRVPYYAYSPGSLYVTKDLVTVEGAETYPPDGNVLLTTISVSPRRLTAFNAVRGWLDPTVSVFEERVVVGDQDRDAVRQFNLQLMTSSQEIATYVALDRLGYDIELSGSGAFVADVQPGSAADGVLEPGDTIVSIGGESVELSSEVVSAIGALSPGDEVELGVQPLDSDETETRTVVIGSREDDPDAPLLGVEVQTRDGAFVYPDGVEVDITTNGIGGPSAGLTFTLTILDMMTPGDLTGGRTIAATGEMRLDGTIGPIGGIEQKAVTVRRAGVDVFLVPDSIPEDEMEAARRQAGDAVQIIQVGTLDEALAALESLGGDPLVEVAPAA